MHLEPKISIIVPVYNTAKYLRKCLDSLVNQSMSEIELVVINDGSTDNSLSIIEEYQKNYPNLFLVVNQNNSGQAVARNLGISLCHGEYVGFLDSDDYMDLSYCEKMYRAAQETNADYVACGYTDVQYVEEGENTVINKYVASKVAHTTRDLFFDVYVSPSLHLYKRDLFDKAKVEFPTGVLHEDTAFYVNLIPYIQSIAVVEEPLFYRVRREGSSTMTLTAKKVADIFPVIENIINYYHDHQLWNQWKEEVEYFCVRILTGSSIHRVSWIDNASERKDLINQTKKFITLRFPDYKKNSYLQKGARNFYIRHFSTTIAGLVVCLYRIKERRSLI